MVTPGRSDAALRSRFSAQRRQPMSHSARACSAVVLPELFGPMKTAALPRSNVASCRRLKLRIVKRVIIEWAHVYLRRSVFCADRRLMVRA